jgi:DNA-binding transcriptional MerR regulator/methanogenic corrinoid protein MtbC1
MMSSQEDAQEAALPIAVVARETGLSQDVLRKWESRYGFPAPERDAVGERRYPAWQMVRLRLVKRLLDIGMRPARVVGLDADTLAGLVESQQPRTPVAEPGGFEAALLRGLREQDAPVLRQMLSRMLYRDGLESFVQDRMAVLLDWIGEAWARGEVSVHEEHLFSEVVAGLLRAVVEDLGVVEGRPRILLTTLPGEQHGLGLLMVAALAALEGAYCLSLGTQTPGNEIRDAVAARGIDIVALSFSIHYPARQIAPALDQLRGLLPDSVSLWVGGGGVLRLAKASAGVRIITELARVPGALADWRGC